MGNYVRNDGEVLRCLKDTYDSAYPIISVSSDAQRQFRINQQMAQLKQFEMSKLNHATASIPKPKEMAVTKKKAPFVDVFVNEEVAHNKVYCLFHGCCGNPTLVKKKKESFVVSEKPPFKKMRLSEGV